MITVSINPIIFSIGHFHLRWYSLIVITAIAVGVWLTAREAGRFLITFWSSYQIVALGLNQAQIISLAALAIGLPWLVYLIRKSRPVSATI